MSCPKIKIYISTNHFPHSIKAITSSYTELQNITDLFWRSDVYWVTDHHFQENCIINKLIWKIKKLNLNAVFLKKTSSFENFIYEQKCLRKLRLLLPHDQNSDDDVWDNQRHGNGIWIEINIFQWSCTRHQYMCYFIDSFWMEVIKS